MFAMSTIVDTLLWKRNLSHLFDLVGKMENEFFWQKHLTTIVDTSTIVHMRSTARIDAWFAAPPTEEDEVCISLELHFGDDGLARVDVVSGDVRTMVPSRVLETMLGGARWDALLRHAEQQAEGDEE